MCERYHLALRAIAGMKIDENTDIYQLLTLCIAIAKIALEK